MANKKKKLKTCFVISPIGEPRSETRHRSDQILKHIIKPVAEKHGFKVERADLIPKPGIITSQIAEHLMEDDLVISDLTELNPNVFYELAIRHAVRKPVIHMIHEKQKIPFDISQIRIINFNHQDLDSVEECKKNLSKQIEEIEKDPNLVDSPISTAVDLMNLRSSDNPTEHIFAEIIQRLQELSAKVDGLTTPSLSNYFSDMDGMVHSVQSGLTVSPMASGRSFVTSLNSPSSLDLGTDKLDVTVGSLLPTIDDSDKKE